MELSEFTKNVSGEFFRDQGHQERLKFAREVAAHYDFEIPEGVLLYTHPEFARMPLDQRCAHLGITEEQLLLLSRQKGFRRFQSDWQELLKTSLVQQSIEKVGRAIAEDRDICDSDGNVLRQDFSLEMKLMEGVLGSGRSEGVQPSVVVNLFEQARARAQTIAADVVVPRVGSGGRGSDDE